VHIQYGLSAGNHCLFPVSFDGYLVARNQPVLDPDTWQLRFATLSSHLETRNRNPARLADFIWQRVQSHLPALLDGITIDLGIPQKELGKFLQSVLPADKPKEVLRVIESLRPGHIEIRKTSLSFLQQMDIPETMYMETEPSAPTVLTQEQKQDFIAEWETWDAFVVHMITALSSRPLTRAEQHTLLDVILKLRYAFSSELDKSDPETKDFVRKQFILSWELVSPVFKSHLMETGVDSMLGYLAFFSAADSLVTLDRLGPLLGLDISRQGLHQLATLVAEGKAPSLNYDSDISPHLKNTLGIEQSVSDQAGWLFRLKQLPHLYRLVFGTAFAWADIPEKHMAHARQWLLYQESPAAYLEKTIRLIKEQTEGKLQDTRIPGDRHAMFRRTVLATAWQESCFRQFIKTQESIISLRSYNQTSVGIMQINERVWRGIYDQEKLRWDIAYNAMTGCDILALYFTRYAVRWQKKQPDPAVDDDFLAGMLYAMYYGGPGHLEKYVQRSSEPDSSYLNDRLFREKWAWVKQGDLDQIGLCLAGRPIPFEH
ncbi:MAG: lytic transglycosylase domain-containing protein, partial [Desulfobacteraceae bacterium]|nr:lytic transglycosylase domain-containing protein [Desulfobacteraceae bacterium]